MAEESMSDDRMLYIGFCRVCGTGPLGLRTCGSCERVLVVCDECDSVWTDDNTVQPPAATGGTTLVCPHCEGDLYSHSSHWSTHEEAARCEWLSAALDSGGLALLDGESLPDSDANETA